MNDTAGGTAAPSYIAREVVGLFDSPASLDAAVTKLAVAGIDRAAISVLGSNADRSGAAALQPAWVLSDDPGTPRSAFASFATRGDAKAVAIAVPLEIAGLGTAWAVAAAGGALVLAIGATAVAGVVAAGLGALVYRVVAVHHAANIQAEIAQGGLILWVAVQDKATEERTMVVLRACGATHVHAHLTERHWGVADSPLHGVQPDPFLEHDPEADAV